MRIDPDCAPGAARRKIGRAEAAAEAREHESDDWAQADAERDLSIALEERESAELVAIDEALAYRRRQLRPVRGLRRQHRHRPPARQSHRDALRRLPGKPDAFRARAPRGVMDYLLFMLMFWGQQQGFARFNLGVAPFSGLEVHPLDPDLEQGNFLYSHAEDFYNFRGLRSYKENLRPDLGAELYLDPGRLGAARNPDRGRRPGGRRHARDGGGK